MKSIIPLEAINQDFPAKQTFQLPLKYQTLGVEFENDPVWIEFDNIRSLDDDKNIGSAPSVVVNNSDVCKSAFSAGVQTQILGIASGMTITDENCERLKLARSLYGMDKQ